MEIKIPLGKQTRYKVWHVEMTAKEDGLMECCLVIMNAGRMHGFGSAWPGRDLAMIDWKRDIRSLHL